MKLKDDQIYGYIYGFMRCIVPMDKSKMDNEDGILLDDNFLNTILFPFFLFVKYSYELLWMFMGLFMEMPGGPQFPIRISKKSMKRMKDAGFNKCICGMCDYEE